MFFQSSTHVIKDEKIGYNQSVIVNSKELTEVFYYTREFETYINFKLCTVQLNIPYSGLRGYDSVARILLYLDEDLICDGSIYSKEAYVLRPLNLSGYKSNLIAGHHKLILKACTDNAELHIPHININGSEYIIKPPISGSIIIVGYI